MRVGGALFRFPSAGKTGPECCQTNIEHMVWLSLRVSSRGSDQVDTELRSLFQGHSTGCQRWDHCLTRVLQKALLTTAKQILVHTRSPRVILFLFSISHERPSSLLEDCATSLRAVWGCRSDSCVVQTPVCSDRWQCWGHVSLPHWEPGMVAWLSGIVFRSQKCHRAFFRALMFVSLMSLSPKPKACNITFPVWGFLANEV